MRRLLVLIPICVLSVSAADISALSGALVSKNKPKLARRRVYKVKLETKKLRELKDALVLKLTSNQYLGRELSPNEEFNLEGLAMEILDQGLSRTDSNYSEMLRKLKKSNSLVSRVGSLLVARAGYVNPSPVGREAAIYIRSKQAEMKQLFRAYRSLFLPESRTRPSRAEEVKEQLMLLCGPGAVLELNALLQRSERGQLASAN